jgi:ADP-ribose pyrophosphatase
MEPWKTLGSEIVFDAAPFVRVSKQRVALPDGGVIEDFYQVHLRPFSLTVPITEDGRVLILRAYKHGPGRVCLTFPGGFIDPGETPENAARRELLEEAGYAGTEIVPLGSFTDNGNQKGCTGHYFLVRGCRGVQPPSAGDHEEMALELHDPAALDGFLRDGTLAITHDAAAWAFARLHMGQAGV